MDFFAGHPDMDITYTDSVFISDNKATAIDAPEFNFNLLCTINFINGSSIVMRRKVLETLSWNEEYRNCEDWDYWLRAYKEGFKFARVPGRLTANFRHSANLSRDTETEAYYHSKVCIAHGLPIEVAANRMIFKRDPMMIKGIMKAWSEENE
jgi:GT2 family glycosyltransferase